jgi:predicted nucleic acid-binding protein
LTLVLDTSLTLSWYLEDEVTVAADAVLDRVVDSGAVVPALWRIEVLNAFQTAIRRRRIDAAFRDTALARLAAMPITVDPDTDMRVWSATLHLVDRFRLTAYDAVYLELAQRRELPLATLDQELRAAGAVLGVPLLGREPP